MDTRSKLLAGLLAAFFAFGAVACEVEDFEGDPLEDDPMLEEEGEGDAWEDDGDDGTDA
jgi:hypothetical protein